MHSDPSSPIGDEHAALIDHRVSIMVAAATRVCAGSGVRRPLVFCAVERQLLAAADVQGRNDQRQQSA